MKRRVWAGDRTGQNRNQLVIDWEASARKDDPPPTGGNIVADNSATVAPMPAQAIETPGFAPYTPRRRYQDAVARLPVPRPLPVAIASGRFGQDEEGHPIHPAADEVRAITENQAEKLIDMLDALTSMPGHPAATNALPDTFRSILAAYAQDFGERAARQLEAYARRHASLDESDRTDQGWRR